MGRPLKDIDGEMVRKLARLGCTQEEIAARLECARTVISERFRQEFNLGKAQSKTSLRYHQWKRATAGSDAMLIHLGKTYLDQKDRVDVTSGDKPLNVSFESITTERDEDLPPPAEATDLCEDEC